MLKIYGADLSAPANKVRFVANYLDLEYDYIRVRVRDGEHRKASFLQMNPAGKIPVIDDNGFILFESDAIIKYMAKKQSSNIYPNDLLNQAVVDQWMDFVGIHINGAMGRVAFNRLFAPLAKVEVDTRSLQDGLRFLSKYLPVVEQRLSQFQYLALQNISLADFSLLSALDSAELAKVDLSDFKFIKKWRALLQKEKFYTQCYKSYGDSLKVLMGQSNES